MAVASCVESLQAALEVAKYSGEMVRLETCQLAERLWVNLDDFAAGLRIDARGSVISCGKGALAVVGTASPQHAFENRFQLFGGKFCGESLADSEAFLLQDLSASVIMPDEITKFQHGLRFHNKFGFCENNLVGCCGFHDLQYAISHTVDKDCKQLSAKGMRVADCHFGRIGKYIFATQGKCYDAFFERITANIPTFIGVEVEPLPEAERPNTTNYTRALFRFENPTVNVFISIGAEGEAFGEWFDAEDFLYPTIVEGRNATDAPFRIQGRWGLRKPVEIGRSRYLEAHTYRGIKDEE